MAISSGNPIPTKPPVAIVSPSRMTRMAASADTTFPFLARSGVKEESMGWGCSLFETILSSHILKSRHLQNMQNQCL